MNLREMMNKNIINLEMKAISKSDAINRIAFMLYEAGRITSLGDFIDDVYKREELETTNMDMGVAIPHSQSDVIKKSSIAIVRLRNEISWEDYGEPVKIIFLLAVSPNDTGVEHLEVISQVAEFLVDEKFIKRLHKVKNPNRLLRLMYRMVGG